MLCCLHRRQSTTLETEKRDTRWEDLSEQVRFNLKTDGLENFNYLEKDMFLRQKIN